MSGAVSVPAREARATASGSTSFLALVTGGHMGIHWYQQLFPMVIPTIKSALGLSDVQVGTMSTVRQLTDGMMNLPIGFGVDAFPRRRALILAGAVVTMGLGYTVVGVMPVFGWALLGVALVGLGNCAWHPAAMAALSERFPERRGAALSVHGMAATVMDSLTPLVVGALLAAFVWRDVLAVQVLPAVLIGLVLWRSLSPAFRDAPAAPRKVSGQARAVVALRGNRLFLGFVAANALWMAGRQVILTFLPIYLQEDLGYSTVVLGLYIFLLNVLGIVSQPLLGLFSDRFGRRVVLLPCYVILGLLYMSLAYAPAGPYLTAVIAAIGIFFYPVGNVLQAAIFDVVDREIAASAAGLKQFLQQLTIAPAPILAGLTIGTYGYGAVFLACGALMLIAAVIVLGLRAPRTR